MNRVSLGESRIGLWAERKGILKGTKRCEYAQWGGVPQLGAARAYSQVWGEGIEAGSLRPVGQWVGRSGRALHASSLSPAGEQRVRRII